MYAAQDQFVTSNLKKGGAFAYATMDDVIETSAPYLAQASGMSLDEAVSFMGVLLPTLDHWKASDSAEARPE